jgi:hypothetical protein
MKILFIGGLDHLVKWKLGSNYTSFPVISFETHPLPPRKRKHLTVKWPSFNGHKKIIS